MFKKLLVLFLLLSGFFALVHNDILVFAQEVEQDNEKVDDLEDKIEEYEEKIEDLQGQANTLSREIESVNSQISLTSLKIQNSINNIARKEQEIQDLTEDIGNLALRIDKLTERIAFQQDVLQERMRARYKTKEASSFLVFFGSDDLNRLVQKATYLKVMEHQDNKILGQMHQTKTTYDRQKQLFEEKKAEEEELRQQLQVEKTNLDSYKGQLEDKKYEKNRLLEVTQNNEQKYQELLADAKKELQQIVGAVSVLRNQGSTEVKKGQLIGYQGNTGYSFGEHLHFGVYRYSSFEEIAGWDWYYSDYVDPLKKLKSKKVYWDDGCSSAKNKTVGSGDWTWPVDSPTISQGFGYTCWSSSYYGGKVHPALDMYGDFGAPVYAVDDGEAYFCDNCLGDGANGVFIFHDDDYMTIYWHLK